MLTDSNIDSMGKGPKTDSLLLEGVKPSTGSKLSVGFSIVLFCLLHVVYVYLAFKEFIYTDRHLQLFEILHGLIPLYVSVLFFGSISVWHLMQLRVSISSTSVARRYLFETRCLAWDEIDYVKIVRRFGDRGTEKLVEKFGVHVIPKLLSCRIEMICSPILELGNDTKRVRIRTEFLNSGIATIEFILNHIPEGAKIDPVLKTIGEYISIAE